MVSKSGCLEWLKKRTNLEKVLLASSSILLLSLLIMILIGVASKGNKANNPFNDETSCWSVECNLTAEEVLKSLDPEADACSNFYDYACGKYGLEPGQTVSVASRSKDSVYFSLRRLIESKKKFDIQGLDDARSFYNNCVKFGSVGQDVKETRESLLHVMREFGVDIWPIINSQYEFDDWVEHSKLERYLVNLILLDVPVAFNMEVVPDQQISGSYLVKISPGRPRETGRTQEQIRNDTHLRLNVLTSFFLIGASTTNVFTDVIDIISMDSEFAKIEQDRNTACDDVDTLAPQEVKSELKRLIKSYREIDWDVILSEIRNQVGINKPFAVELHCKEKIKNYFDYLDTLTERSVTNYLGWRLYSKFVEIVIPTFEKYQFVMGEPVSRWRVCLELMEKFYTPILEELLSREIFNKDVQEEVERISNATLSAAKLLVSRTSWLSDVQKSRIADKVSKIEIRYPYKKHYGDAGQIVIPKVNVSNFMQVVIQLQRDEVIQSFRRLNRGIESSGTWKPMLTEVDNFGSTDLAVYVYYDKIRTPYLRQQELQWMNYGGFGMSIAREISRVLIWLNAGGGHEEKDLVWNLWARNSTRSLCLRKMGVTLFQNLNSLPQAKSFMETSLLKSIMDHSALEIAYEAAKSTIVSSKSLPGLDFSDEQSFFISYAQTTCEADFQPKKKEQISLRERLKVIRSFKSFNEVFRCKSSQTCHIWA